MDSQLRAQFNADFSAEKYQALLHCVNRTKRWPADFRICESPIFLTDEFAREAVAAAREIVRETRTPEFKRHAASAVPAGLSVPNEPDHPNFLVIDFGICLEGDRLVPRLIELQAFPSLFGFQWLLLGCMRKAYPALPRSWSSSFGGIKDDAYLELLGRTIFGGGAPRKTWSCWRSSRKSKRRGSISPPRKRCWGFAPSV